MYEGASIQVKTTSATTYEVNNFESLLSIKNSTKKITNTLTKYIYSNGAWVKQ